MDKQELIKALQMDVEIPEVVQERVQEAFDKVRIMCEGKENRGNEAENGGRKMGDGIESRKKVQDGGNMEYGESVENRESTECEGRMEFRKKEKPRGSIKNRKNARGKSGFPIKRAAVIFLAATFACAGITAAAVYFRWGRSMEEGMQITEQQKIQLEEEHAVAFAMQECTVQGVTVTAVQSITDNYFAHIVFRVEGYELADGAEPAFEGMEIKVDGKDDFNWTASFYNGLLAGSDGKAVYADGSPIDYDSEGGLERFVMEDGSMEYVVTLSSYAKGYFIDKQIHVELENLGTVAKAAYLGSEVEGTWSFDWNLQGKDSMEVYTLQEPLGDTGAVAIKAELSPISVHVEYDFPMKQVTEEGVDENGEKIYAHMYAEPPMFTGVKLKDGTLYPYLRNGGSMGYEEEDSDIYVVTFAMDRVIDVGQVESLLFIKSYPEGGGVPSEENFYVVPIG